MPDQRSPHSASALLDAVEQSPKAVAVHDKSAWVGIFAADGQVNDPVGSTPHVGPEAIARFFDTFIAPNTIKFDVQHDVVAGMSVVRDLTVYTTMSTGVTMQIPMHLRYDLSSDGPDGALQIQKLFAHWELQKMVGQLLTSGGRGLLASMILGPQLLRHQGLSGCAGFLRGLSGVRKRGKRRVVDLVAALGRADVTAVSALLAPHAWRAGVRKSSRRMCRALYLGAGGAARRTQDESVAGPPRRVSGEDRSAIHPDYFFAFARVGLAAACAGWLGAEPPSVARIRQMPSCRCRASVPLTTSFSRIEKQ